mmetsp:Transcript_88136/g.252603  ORF Transcript_88136/g.252603 Transcript_88136/m.252603 type:complete len:209 (-) Transcript_88136:1077-1703(-)
MNWVQEQGCCSQIPGSTLPPASARHLDRPRSALASRTRARARVRKRAESAASTRRRDAELLRNPLAARARPQTAGPAARQTSPAERRPRPLRSRRHLLRTPGCDAAQPRATPPRRPATRAAESMKKKTKQAIWASHLLLCGVPRQASALPSLHAGYRPHRAARPARATSCLPPQNLRRPWQQQGRRKQTAQLQHRHKSPTLRPRHAHP